MKKRITALALALVMVLGVAALAASGEKNISVLPMTMTVNGTPVTPAKSDGTAAEVFSYNGATYAPLRYLSDLLGIEVEWDANDPSVAKLVGNDLKIPTGAVTPSGTFTATADGFGGDVTVTLTLADSVLTDVKVDGGKETRSEERRVGKEC